MSPKEPTATEVKTLGELEQAVLFALLHLQQQRPDECYSMGIRDEIERRSGRRLSPGALYTVLDRLEGHRMVTSFLGEPTSQRGGRRKKMIHLEAPGVAALDVSVQRFEQMSQGLLKDLRALRKEAEPGGSSH